MPECSQVVVAWEPLLTVDGDEHDKSNGVQSTLTAAAHGDPVFAAADNTGLCRHPARCDAPAVHIAAAPLPASSAQNHHPTAESIAAAIANDAQQNKLNTKLAIAVCAAPAVDVVRSAGWGQRYHSPYFSEWTKHIYGLVNPQKEAFCRANADDVDKRSVVSANHVRQLSSLRQLRRPHVLVTGPNRRDCHVEERLEGDVCVAICLRLLLYVSSPNGPTRIHSNCGLGYFPQLILCLPHILFISIILATYPYPASNAKDSGGISSIMPEQPPPAEGSIPWQANIQGIQNIMGTLYVVLPLIDSSILTSGVTSSDLSDFVKPYAYHLRLTPTHLYPDNPSNLHPSASASSNMSPSNSANSVSSDPAADATSNTDASPRQNQKRKTPQSSPYTSHILTLLIVTLPPLAYIISLPMFPLRFVFFLGGAAPVLSLHPWALDVLVPTAVLLGKQTWNSPLPESVVKRVDAYKRWLELRFNQRSSRGKMEGEGKIQSEGEESEDSWIRKWRYAALKTIVQRVVDDDRLTDVYWRSEMREVELWENERYVGKSLFSPLYPLSCTQIRLTAIRCFLKRSNIVRAWAYVAIS